MQWTSSQQIVRLILDLIVFKSSVDPGGGLRVFTDRDKRSIFWVFNFKNLYFLGYWSQQLYFFGLLNKSYILKCFKFLTVFFGFSFIHQVLQ